MTGLALGALCSCSTPAPPPLPPPPTCDPTDPMCCVLVDSGVCVVAGGVVDSGVDAATPRADAGLPGCGAIALTDEGDGGPCVGGPDAGVSVVDEPPAR